MPNPLVSILINNYNYARFVGEAVEAALAQTYDNIEIIVVDDGSSDNSLEILERYRDRIRLVVKENGGQASAFNAGFAASKGEIICLLDADDLFAAEKVSHVVARFKDDPEIGWCFDITHEFDSRTDSIERAALDKVVLPSIQWGKCDLRKRIAAGKPPYIQPATSGLSFRRDLLSTILPMPEVITIVSDNYIKFVAISVAPGWLTPEKLTLQRIHGDNVFTGRTTGKARLRGQIGLITGISLYEKSLDLRIIGVRQLGYSLSVLWLSGGFDRDARIMVRSVFRKLDGRGACEVLARAIYFSIRDGLQSNIMPRQTLEP